jgi:carboxypeptidase C (cathepsin A)
MTMKPHHSLSALALIAVLGAPDLSAAQAIPKALAKSPEVSTAATKGPRQFVSEQTATFNGKKVTYVATLGETIVQTPDGKPGASLFNFSYVAKGGDATKRPVVFIFNGGPGSASNTLQLGALGPKRMAKFTPAAQADASVPLIDNPYTLLDVADLVFIDPPETGYSKMLDGVPGSAFHSVDADSYACAQFMALWLKDNGRLASSHYIVGESYGSLRAVGMTRELANAKPAIGVDGIVLISQAITYGTGRSRLFDPLSAIKPIPQMAAIAWHHGKIDNRNQTVDQAVEKARVFARTDYIQALIRGNDVTAAEKARLAARLAEITGIPAKTWLDNNLRPKDIRTEMFKAEGKVLDQYDGREFEPPRAAGERKDWVAAQKGLTTNTEAYATGDLKVAGLTGYVSLNASAGRDWNYGAAPEPTLDLVLAEEMRNHQNLRLMVTQGLFDTTTGIGSTEYTMGQVDLPMDRFRIAYYPGGHMLYSDEVGLKAFTGDLRAFVTAK